MTFQSIAELENQVLNLVNNNSVIKSVKAEIDTYTLSDLKDRLKRYFLREVINKFNVWNIKRHDLNERNEVYLNLFGSDEFNFIEIEENVKTFFSKLSKEDKIKEVTPSLKLDKYFKQDKSYFSLWDLKKSFCEEIEGKWVFNQEKARTEISKAINDKKEVCIDFYGIDKYRREESIKDILDFLRLAFDLESLKDLELNYKEVEKYENNEVKIKFCKEWAYITLADEQKQNKLKSLKVENTLKRLERA